MSEHLLIPVYWGGGGPEITLFKIKTKKPPFQKTLNNKTWARNSHTIGSLLVFNSYT